MKILLDFDSTTADLDSHMRKSVYGRFGVAYTAEEITSWDWWSERPEEQGTYVWGSECFGNRDWTLSIPPVEGAIEGIEELIDEGHTIVVVSDRSPSMREWLRAWLARYGISIPVYTTKRWGKPTKLDMIRELGLQLVIEDAPHHAIEMSASGLVEGVLLLDKPWNRNAFGAGIGRCFSWTHILDTIRILDGYWLTTKEMAFKD